METFFKYRKARRDGLLVGAEETADEAAECTNEFRRAGAAAPPAGADAGTAAADTNGLPPFVLTRHGPMPSPFIRSATAGAAAVPANLDTTATTWRNDTNEFHPAEAGASPAAPGRQPIR
jgi:hypothetical protein